MNDIVITKKASKQIGKLDTTTMKAVYDAIDTLKSWPNTRQVKSLTNIDGYRLRVGNFRVLFTVSANVITITEVKKRNERTY